MSTMTKPERSQASRLNDFPRPIRRIRKILSFVACLILIFSLFVTPASAADSSVSSFIFYPNTDIYFPPEKSNCDSYVVCHNNSGLFYLIYFNDADVGDSFTAKTYGTSYYEFHFPAGTTYYTFSDAASCFSFLRFGSETCDVESLATYTAGSDYIRAKNSGLFFTNSSSLKTNYLDKGPGADESYYAYFNNIDSKQYVLCICTVEGIEDPVAIFTNSIPFFNSYSKTLSCSENMFFFHGNSEEDCINFFKHEDGSGLNKIDKGTSLSNVTAFLASSCNIVDTATGQVCFPSTNLGQIVEGGMSTDEITADGIHSSDKLSKSMIQDLLDLFDSIVEAIKSIPSLFDWLPDSFRVAIYSTLITFCVILVVFLVLKIIHG